MLLKCCTQYTSKFGKFSNGHMTGRGQFSFQSQRSESESHSVVSNSLQPHGLCSPWNSPGQNTGVGSISLLQGSFPTQGLNPGVLHCRRILYQLSHRRFRFTVLDMVDITDNAIMNSLLCPCINSSVD